MAADKKSNNTKNTMLWRVYMTMLIMIILSVIVLLQIGRIQIFKGKELKELADKRLIRSRPVSAPRGNILAEDGSLLATSLPYYDVSLDPTVMGTDSFLYYLDTLSYCFATFIDDELTPGAFRQKMFEAHQTGNRYISIKNNTTLLQLEHIRSFPYFRNILDDTLSIEKDISKNQYVSGLIIKKVSRRQYPFGGLASRTIGYIRYLDSLGGPVSEEQLGQINNGVKDTSLVGLEGYFHEQLGGISGRRSMRQLGTGIWVPVEGLEYIEPKSGQDIVTTIDINIQEVAQNALKETLQTYQGDYGCAIVMEVKTGKIKAISNLGYNRQHDYYYEDYNHAVGFRINQGDKRTPPGSIFKLASTLALLEDGYITPTDTINLNGGRAVFMGEEMEDASAHGLYRAPFAKAFEISSNVGIALLTNEHYNQTREGQEQYIRRLKEMRLDQLTGIEIMGESTPYLPDPDDPKWSGVSIPYSSIGYEFELTPLQMLTFYNAVANDGAMMKPYLVNEVRAYGEAVQAFRPKTLERRIASPQTINYAQELLMLPVQGKRGTARAIATSRYNIAGKTGTAIINYKEHKDRGVPKKYRASFAGYFPAEDPMYTCIVVVNDPKSGFYGGTVAAPVFRKIADYCYTHTIEVHPPLNASPLAYTSTILPDLQVGYKGDMTYVMQELAMPMDDQSNTAWTAGRVADDTLHLLTRDIQDDIIPSVIGMGLRDALFLLENRGLEVRVVGVGKVRSQSVKAGLNKESASRITLILG